MNSPILLLLLIAALLAIYKGANRPSWERKKNRIKDIYSMEGLRIIRIGHTLHIVVKCEPGVNPRDIAHRIIVALKEYKGLRKGVIYKLGIQDNMDTVVGDIVRGNTPSGVVVQEWHNLVALYKYISAIEGGALPPSELCSV